MQPYINYIISAEKLPFALVAVILSILAGLVAGALRGRLNPVFWDVMEALFQRPILKLNRPHRTYPDLIIRGFLLTVTAAGLSFFLGAMALVLSVEYPLYGLTAVILLWPLLSAGALWRVILNLHLELKGAQSLPKDTYYPLSVSTRYNLATADDYTITRLGIAYSTQNLTRGIIMPVFWFLMGGLPAAYLASSISYLSWRTSKGGYSKGFGLIPEKLNLIFEGLPSVLTSILLTFSCIFTPTASLARAAKALLSTKQEANCPYVQGGKPAVVMAWALKISLGGSYIDYDGRNIRNKWIGPKNASARLESGHLKRAVYLQAISVLLTLLFLLGLIQILAPGNFIDTALYN